MQRTATDISVDLAKEMAALDNGDDGDGGASAPGPGETMQADRPIVPTEPPDEGRTVSDGGSNGGGE
jgi:hypothetical protein